VQADVRQRPRTGYTQIPWQEVQPGDVYKFTGTTGLVHIGVVKAVQGRLVEVAWWDTSRANTWVYRDVQRVTFGRATQ